MRTINNIKFLILLQNLIIQIYSAVSWNDCITLQPNPCPKDCITSGYVRDQTTNLCLPPPYSFCNNISGVCDPAQPNYYLQACIDYGFKNDSVTSLCVPPTCIDNETSCPTKTTYCADQKYVNDPNNNNICYCPIPLRDWQGQCTNILSISQLQFNLFISFIIFISVLVR